jgi:ribonuclease-3
MATLDDLQERLGWTFHNQALLVEALTHSTYANENASAGPANERLEFLGDAVIGLLSADLLYAKLGNAPEGELTRRRARVVRQESLAGMANDLRVAEHLRLGSGPRRARTQPSMLADAYEALAGAVFLDGGYEAVVNCFAPAVRAAIDQATEPIDFKTLLQEACHRLGQVPPRYRVVSVAGPDHARRYTCEAIVDDQPLGRGSGSSKKAAEQECAQMALARMQRR